MPLAQLLGLAQAAPATVAGPLDEVEESEEIVVDANRMDPYALENAPAIARRDIGLEAGREASDHRGMFGTKGTLRDILGIVGDAFLVQSGNKPMYAPVREQERISDAMAGFTEDPMAAIERVAGESPMLAQKMLEQYQANQYQTAQQQSLAASRESMINTRNDARLNDLRKFASQAIASAGDNPESQAYAIELIKQQADRQQIPLEDLGISEDMTAEQMRVLADAGMSVQNIRNLPLNERRVATGERNAATAERNAARPRPPRSISRQEQFENFRRIPKEDRTEEEQGFIDEYIGANRRRGASSGPRQLRGSEGNPTSSLRIRPVGQ